jgi:hypothetical protein
MTTMIANYVGKKFLGETIQNNFGQEVSISQHLILFVINLS